MYPDIPSMSIIQISSYDRLTDGRTQWEKDETDHITRYKTLYGSERVLNMTAGGDGGNQEHCPVGEDCSNVKRSWKQVNEMRNLYLNTPLLRDEIAFLYGDEGPKIQLILEGKSWPDSNYHPELVSFKISKKERQKQLLVYQTREDYVEGYSPPELAETSGCSPKTIRQWIRGEKYKDPDWDGKRKSFR